MKIDGKQIAEGIKAGLKKQVSNLRQKNIIPHLAVILVGADPASITYIKRKQKVGEELGIKLSYYPINSHNSRIHDPKKELYKLVKRLNKDNSVHGIIIQRPVPININTEDLDNLVIPSKDVDGFHPASPFTPPVAKAVLKILENVYTQTKTQKSKEFLQWLKKQAILLIGRGETGGNPIARTFTKMGIGFIVAHSQTKNLEKLCSKSKIIISCVGKPDIVRHDMITSKTTLIGVGLHPEEDKLRTDYNQEEIAGRAKYYTPVPGGVGPVNVACLFDNLIQATTKSLRPLKKNYFL